MNVGRLIFTLIGLGLAFFLIQLLPLPSPFPQLIQIVIVLAAIYLILVAFGMIPGPTWWSRNPPPF